MIFYFLKSNEKELRKAFDMFDADKNGTISVSEIKNVLKKVGKDMSDEEIKKMMAEVDKDKSGEIDFDEFCQMIKGNANLIEEAFKVFDCNGDGFITANELVYVMNAVGEELTLEEADEMVKEADKNGDFQISFEEFKAMLEKVDA